MISDENPEKAELLKLMREFIEAINHECDMSTEPCKSIHEGLMKLRLFVADPEDMVWRGDLSMADVGEAFLEAASCACWMLKPKFDEGHHPDCPMWDSKAGHE